MKLIQTYPQNNAKNICIDTEIALFFDVKPTLNNSGLLRVYDYQTDELIDCLDLSIPNGPVEPRKNPSADYLHTFYKYGSSKITNRTTVAGTPSADYERVNENFQLTIIGGFSDGFHFYPAYIKDNAVFFQLHHNLLEYGRKYYILADEDIADGFIGINDKNAWTFTTKSAISLSDGKITVAKNGKGDFETVQGAIDAIPDHLDKSSPYVIHVKNGDYRELVYFRNKDYITIIGENVDDVVIHYANNEIFNPHPDLIKTNEKRGTFPSRRAAFAIDNCTHIILKNLTVKNDAHGQAEGLLINGKCNYFENVRIIGSGDALQTNGSAYFNNCVIDGEGDTVLGRGPAFFYKTVLNIFNAFMWIRNTKEHHGNVFVECVFNGKNNNAVIARLPNNNGFQYPNAECVLIDCELNNIPPIGFYPIDDDALTATLCEYNSHDKNGKPLDMSSRHRCVKILTYDNDREFIENYKNYKFVLGKDYDLDIE